MWNSPDGGKSEPTSSIMGLTSPWLQILQGGAIVLICVMFYQDRHVALDAAREDRAMFRAELREQRQALEKVAQGLDRLAGEVEKLKRP